MNVPEDERAGFASRREVSWTTYGYNETFW